MKLIIAGDFCPQGRVSSFLEKGDCLSVLGSVKDLVSVADYAIVNYECPITKGGEKPIIKQGPNLQCSSKGIEAVKWAGFACVTLANNHFYDFGDEGVKNTLEKCKEAGIDTVGGGLNISEASAILYKHIGEKTLAVINCCEHEFSIASEKYGGSNPLNPIQQYYAIKEAKGKADYVVVIVHGGHEHYQLPSPRMVETYRFFIDAGADAVVNHHQHCYSGYEVYKGKPVFYGLGNFCFDNTAKRSGIWTEGYMVSIEFSTHNPIFEIHPYKQCSNEPRVEMLSQTAYNEDIKKLNAIIANPKELQARVDAYYTSCEAQYSSIFEPLRNHFYLAAKRRGWLPSLISKSRKLIALNYIICEAHRDKLIHWLKNSFVFL